MDSPVRACTVAMVVRAPGGVRSHPQRRPRQPLLDELTGRGVRTEGVGGVDFVSTEPAGDQHVGVAGNRDRGHPGPAGRDVHHDHRVGAVAAVRAGSGMQLLQESGRWFTAGIGAAVDTDDQHVLITDQPRARGGSIGICSRTG